MTNTNDDQRRAKIHRALVAGDLSQAMTTEELLKALCGDSVELPQRVRQRRGKLTELPKEEAFDTQALAEYEAWTSACTTSALTIVAAFWSCAKLPANPEEERRCEERVQTLLTHMTNDTEQVALWTELFQFGLEDQDMAGWGLNPNARIHLDRVGWSLGVFGLIKTVYQDAITNMRDCGL